MSCHIFPFLMAFIVVSQQPQDLISPPSGFSRGIFVWGVMAGNFNAQLIMSQNKWESSSTFHSRWPVTWLAELWICQHHAGLLELMKAMASCRRPKLGHNIGLFLSDSKGQSNFWGSCLVLVRQWKKRGTIYEQLSLVIITNVLRIKRYF